MNESIGFCAACHRHLLSGERTILWGRISKSLFFLYIAVLLSQTGFAANYTTSSPGNFNSASNWTGNSKPGTYWGNGDTVTVQHAMTITNLIGFAGHMEITSSGSITGTSNDLALYTGGSVSSAGPIDVEDLTINSGTTFSTSASIDLAGDFTNSGATFTSTSTLDVGDVLQVNNSGVFSITGNVTVGNDVELNSGTNSTFGGTLNVTDKITVNGGTAVFNGNTNAGGDITFNSSSNISINAQLNAGDDITFNGASVNIAASGSLSAVDDVIVNSSSNITNSGSVSAGDDVTFNGGTFTNTGSISAGDDITQNGGSTVNNDSPGRIEAGDDYTHNGGTLNNNHHLVVTDRLIVYGGATHTGSGFVQVEHVENYGTVTGTLDICSNDQNNPTFSGSGSYAGGVTFCENASFFPLPVELIRFEYKWIEPNSTLHLEWETASELNNDYFIVLRSNDGGLSFQEIARVNGAGTSNENQIYSLVDPVGEGTGALYYQLQQVDFDGSVQSLEVLLVERILSDLSDLQLYPNPFENQLMIQSEVPLSEVFFLSPEGSIVEAWGQNKLVGNDISLSLEANIPEGVYFLEIHSEIAVRVVKVMKK